jgi:hypothetical protein
VSQHAIILDIVEPGRGVGWVTDGVDIRATRDGRTWRIYGGTSDEYHAEGSTVDVALRRFAETVGVTGTAEICMEYQGNTRRVIDL